MGSHSRNPVATVTTQNRKWQSGILAHKLLVAQKDPESISGIIPHHLCPNRRQPKPVRPSAAALALRGYNPGNTSSRSNLAGTPEIDEVHRIRWGAETTTGTNSYETCEVYGVQGGLETGVEIGVDSSHQPCGSLESSGSHGLEIP